MQCRPGCGACCIAISIHQPYYGMPGGKPAGVPCTHLDAAMHCVLFHDARRPTVCNDFAAERAFCGDTREQALLRLAQLEVQSTPVAIIDGDAA
jgi:hypothetical protein